MMMNSLTLATAKCSFSLFSTWESWDEFCITMGFTSSRCTIPRVWTSKQSKVLGSAKFAPLRLRQNNFFPHALAQAWIVLQNSLVLVTPGRGGGSGDVSVPLLPHSLAVTLTLMWDNAGCFPLGFLAEMSEHFLPDFLFCTLSPCPIQAGEAERAEAAHCHIKDCCRAGARSQGSLPTLAWHPHNHFYQIWASWWL